jgi:hypothetical protein
LTRIEREWLSARQSVPVWVSRAAARRVLPPACDCPRKHAESQGRHRSECARCGWRCAEQHVRVPLLLCLASFAVPPRHRSALSSVLALGLARLRRVVARS